MTHTIRVVWRLAMRFMPVAMTALIMGGCGGGGGGSASPPPPVSPPPTLPPPPPTLEADQALTTEGIVQGNIEKKTNSGSGNMNEAIMDIVKAMQELTKFLT